MEKTKIVLFGPGPLFKGGISNYNTSLAKALYDKPNTDIHIVSWTQQYPSIIPRDFIDRNSKHNFLDKTNIPIHYITNYNNPFTWVQTVNKILEINPQIVIFQWAIALQGIPMGFIVRKLKKKNPNIEIIFDLHLVQQKESSSIDKFCTKYGLSHVNSFIVHANKTAEELQKLFPEKKFTISEDGNRNPLHSTIIKLYHPIYDLFQPIPNFDKASEKLKMGLNTHVFLFFGFIRKYKGLHWVIPAFAELLKQRKDVSLIIAGESFWDTLDKSKWTTRLKKWIFGLAKKIVLKKSDNEEEYYRPLDLIEQYGIQDYVKVVNRFIPNEEVSLYFQLSDAILTFYETATPSGVESLSYNFLLPVLATKVGHFPETIQHGFNGYLAEPGNISDMARIMNLFIENPINRENIKTIANRLSWKNYAEAILMNRKNQN
jgi:glycosyltransferase involved in cell wall biosynthesis